MESLSLAESFFLILFALYAVLIIGWALADLINTKSRLKTSRFGWLLAILLIPFFGAVLYLIEGRNNT